MEIKKNHSSVNHIDNNSNNIKIKFIAIILFFFIFINLFLSIYSLYKVNKIKNLAPKTDIPKESNIITNNNGTLVVNSLDSLNKIQEMCLQQSLNNDIDSKYYQNLTTVIESLKKYQNNEENDQKNRDIFEKSLQLFQSDNLEPDQNVIESFSEYREQQELINLMKGFIECCRKHDEFKITLNSNINSLSELNTWEKLEEKLGQNNNSVIVNLIKDIESGRVFLTFYANLLNILLIQKEFQQKINNSSIPYEKLILKSIDRNYNLFFLKSIRKIIRKINTTKENKIPRQFSNLIMGIK
ncbi:hypothetical protein [Candidatus Phytoplasma mali]|nr:hypothetical protein [Candidatus Phytoplasma mali]